MPKEDLVRIEGVVQDVAPGPSFKVMLENGATVRAVLSGSMRRHSIRVSIHDKVQVELSTYGTEMGRIIYRY